MASDDDDEASPVRDILLGVAIIAATLGAYYIWNFYTGGPTTPEISAVQGK